MSEALRPARFALSRLPSASEMRTAGMTIVGSAPPRPAGMQPAGVAVLSAMMTPTAPASCAFFTLTTKPHRPRSISAILPARAAALTGGASQPSLIGATASS